MALSRKQIESISQTVYRRFPEVSGTPPSVRPQSAPQAKGPSGASAGGMVAGQYLLTFKGIASAPGGRSLNRLVRVVADERGKILKISTSR